MSRISMALAASSMLALTAALTGGAAPASAGEATYLSTDASQCEIFRALNPVVPVECRQAGDVAVDAEFGGLKTRSLKTRAIKLHDTGSASQPEVQSVESLPTETPAEPTAQVAAVQQPESDREFSFAMRIQFEYDSFALTPEARETLDKVAEVLTNELMQDKVIMLEGHADATGPESYNLDLSAQRAQSVRSYLIQEHGIPAERLPFVGMGETDLYDRDHPDSSVNRRVEFTNLTS
jgi:outer membrane protein OmpA-like peptidoglycan-associated protein